MSSARDGLSYRDAGVNIDAANEAISMVKDDIKRTFDANVLEDIGTFGAMYRFDQKDMTEPILVSSVDGVGTKLKLAFMSGKHDTVGIDLVSHCVNDILVQGARPLFFLDYLAAGKLEPTTIRDVIKGITVGCRSAGCSLIGGETAEMPDMYVEGEYDLAGTIIGVVDRSQIVDGDTITDGDVIIGLESSGLHTNGYSLARKIVFDIGGLGLDDPYPGTGKTVAAALMEPHLSYSRLIRLVSRIFTIKGMTHITGGGITDNLPRTLPEGYGAEIELGSWEALQVFKYLQETGQVETREMLRTFNMGMGYLVVISEQELTRAMDAFDQVSVKAYVIGRVVKGPGKVQYTGDLKYAPPN